MRVCNREWALHHGDLLIYSQTSVISRGSQRLWPLVLVCTRILPCIPVSSVTRSAPPVTVLSGWSGYTQAGEGTLVQCMHCTEGGIVDGEEAMELARSPSAIQRLFDFGVLGFSFSYWTSPPGDPVVPTLFSLSLFICHMFWVMLSWCEFFYITPAAEIF